VKACCTHRPTCRPGSFGTARTTGVVNLSNDSFTSALAAFALRLRVLFVQSFTVVVAAVAVVVVVVSYLRAVGRKVL